jgi:hypothetical protein
MVKSAAASVAEYLAGLPPARADVVGAVRDVIVEHLPAGFEERMNWGMISYEVPLARYPGTYNGRPLQAIGLAAQARHYALYLNAVYTSPELDRRLRDGYAAAGLRVDMGKSCLRFRGLDGIDLDVVADLVAAVTPEQYIATYEAGRAATSP